MALGTLAMVPLALGLLVSEAKVIDGSVKMAPQRVGGPLIIVVAPLEHGGVMIIIRLEPGLTKMRLQKLLQLQ